MSTTATRNVPLLVENLIRQQEELRWRRRRKLSAFEKLVRNRDPIKAPLKPLQFDVTAILISSKSSVC
jgi:hypothetical protein